MFQHLVNEIVFLDVNEEAARAQGRNLRDMTLREMDALWEEAKASERKK